LALVQRLGARKRVRADDCASDLFGAVDANRYRGNGVDALEVFNWTASDRKIRRCSRRGRVPGW
jgi:hypothetical protein